MIFTNRFRLSVVAGLFLLAALSNGPAAESTAHLASPDRRIQLSLQLPVPTATNTPHWSATFEGQPILSHCQLGLATATAGELFSGARLFSEKRRSVHDRISVPFGRADHADDHFNELRLTLETPNHTRIDTIFRCYNDAIALRYELPAATNPESVTITDETTSFGIQGNPTAYAQYLETYTTSHEHNVTAVPYHDLRKDTLLDLPLTLSWSNGVCASITEAALRHYSGMSLMRPANPLDQDQLTCRLTPRPDGTKVVRPLPLLTPWRVVLIADRPGALLESETVFCLNEPSILKNSSWIKPGKITFHWWNGDVFDGKPGPPALSFEMATNYIDFCARNGLPTHSITSTEGKTSPWYFQTKPGTAPGTDTDVTRLRPGFDLPAIRAYAESKNVRLWTWVHQAALRGRVEEAFAAFEKMGWSGMMVDFFDHDDQASVEHAEAILAAAARHHILIQLHGIWKPTGLERTYPNLVNHEGALNLEYLKWSDRCTPQHNLMMASTRLIAGQMDYHLGGFRAVPRADFKPRHIAPNVLGTRCHMLALYVCFDNPNPMLADYPLAYENQPGFDFLKIVPTYWDETRILLDQIGELLVTARRKGDTWYLGAISAGPARQLKVPLSFLGAGKYETTLWQDAPDSATQPNHLQTTTLSVTRNDQIALTLASDGGFVANLQIRQK